jgi:hypothetical protein
VRLWLAKAAHMAGARTRGQGVARGAGRGLGARQRGKVGGGGQDGLSGSGARRSGMGKVEEAEVRCAHGRDPFLLMPALCNTLSQQPTNWSSALSPSSLATLHALVRAGDGSLFPSASLPPFPTVSPTPLIPRSLIRKPKPKYKQTNKQTNKQTPCIYIHTYICARRCLLVASWSTRPNVLLADAC